MRVYLASDHAGFDLKAAFVAHLKENGHDVNDVGALEYDPDDDYPSFCIDAATRVVADAGSLGVVIGGSGNGEQIAANKVPGVRACLAWSVETATLGRQHNNANILAVGGRMHEVAEAITFLDAFVSTPFSNDPRHQRRIDQLAEYEAGR
jgi:ribose 5-phosphate isomerase B